MLSEISFTPIVHLIATQVRGLLNEIRIKTAEPFLGPESSSLSDGPGTETTSLDCENSPEEGDGYNG